MKKTLLFLLVCVFLNTFESIAGIPPNPFSEKKAATSYNLTVFDEILFFDGYAATVALPVPPAGVIRHRNDLYAKMLTEEELAAFGPLVTMNVTVKASCDNYDRIGNVNLALVPKGATTYSPNDVQRIELGRFITPFMNKNVMPNEVPYTFDVSNIYRIFNDPSITAVYDIWVELEIFGVPYAAQTQVSGCAGRNDVFFGTLEFVSETDVIGVDGINYLLPLNFKKDLNNYAAGATDMIGQTVRTINFNLPAQVNDASFYLITSNHGANSGGEEYNRRNHYIYLDNNQLMFYKPGSLTCEPFRMYNTQGNGIYGATPRTPAEWQSFSNWCPGDAIPIRKISLGNLTAGAHSFKISVPSAQFVDQQGYIPVSLYLQGTLLTPLETPENNKNNFSVYPNPANDYVIVQSDSQVKSIKLYNLLGQEILKGALGSRIDLRTLETGVYMMQIEFVNDKVAFKRLIKE
jgi:peptide-N-glycosidase F-like protein/type IX secretion system substrate protein